MATTANPVLESFRAALEAMYGDRIDRVILFGSQARNEAGPDSDYDIAIFLHDLNGSKERWAELDKLQRCASASWMRRVPSSTPCLTPRQPTTSARR